MHSHVHAQLNLAVVYLSDLLVCLFAQIRLVFCVVAFPPHVVERSHDSVSDFKRQLVGFIIADPAGSEQVGEGCWKPACPVCAGARGFHIVEARSDFRRQR